MVGLFKDGVDPTKQHFTWNRTIAQQYHRSGSYDGKNLDKCKIIRGAPPSSGLSKQKYGYDLF